MLSMKGKLYLSDTVILTAEVYNIFPSRYFFFAVKVKILSSPEWGYLFCLWSFLSLNEAMQCLPILECVFLKANKREINPDFEGLVSNSGCCCYPHLFVTSLLCLLLLFVLFCLVLFCFSLWYWWRSWGVVVTLKGDSGGAGIIVVFWR